jgi:gliding motility associated protien GldN
MKKFFVYFLLAGCFAMFTNTGDAQTKKRSVKKRTTAKKTTNTKTKVSINPSRDTVITAAKIDSLPIPVVKKSLRSNDAVERNLIKDKVPLAYEHLREDDAIFREKLWREIDIREKMNLPFRYAADDENGNQRFISILFKAIQDGPDNGGVTVFDNIDDRFTTPLTVSKVSEIISGGVVEVPIYDSLGQITGTKSVTAEVNLDSFYKFRIKEEVIFDKESSRLFWRILGIAPVKSIVTSQGLYLGETPLFWVYYPDMRPIFSTYQVYNGKNLGARMSWEDLFESRFFYGRIIKSTMDNPYDRYLKDYGGLRDNQILQLLEGETIKDKIFNYEQNLWSY